MDKASNQKDLLSLLENPPEEFSPVPFWFLNDRLEEDELRRQLRDFRTHGVSAVVLHPRMGMDPAVAYLSPAFFTGLGAAIRAAAELDMRVVLYDEGMYPSGSASGLVVKGHPDLASRGIALTEQPLPGDRVLCRGDQGCIVERFSGGTIRGIHFGEDDGEPGAPPSADILNPEAVARFISLTHEAYWREFGAYFGTVIRGFFTDEPDILGRNVSGMMPWTRGFAKIFTDAGGDLHGLFALFTGAENEDTRLYHRLILAREGEVYYGSLSRWCAAHGIALMGHPQRSDDIELERYFHVPGQDLVYRWVSPEGGGIAGRDSTMAKCSADAARLMGRRRNSNECFGACNRDGNPWHFTGSDMKWYLDWLAVRGVNLFIPHAFFYSLKGSRSAERPPDVGPGSIWWPHYARWAKYMARLSCLMTDTEPHADIAVFCRNRDLCPEKVAPLFETQRGFQYLPESVWRECTEENGKLLCRGRSYRAVLAPAELYPSVSHDALSVSPDCLCEPPQPALRVARFIRCGRECWLLVNEGESEMNAMLTLPMESGLLGQYDLWGGHAARLRAEAVPGGQCFPLRLHPRESLLLFSCESREEWQAMQEAPAAPGWIQPRFELAEELPSENKKVYQASWILDADASSAALCVHAEEMAELYVNGRFCDVGFWPPQRLHIPADALRPGENRLRLVVTGSPANRYGNQKVPYGLMRPQETEQR